MAVTLPPARVTGGHQGGLPWGRIVVTPVATSWHAAQAICRRLSSFSGRWLHLPPHRAWRMPR